MHSYLSVLILIAAFAPTSSMAQQRFRLAEEMRIGSIADADYALSEVGELLVGPEGEILVLQPTERTVAVFDHTGRFVRRIGGKGEGPGEFTRPGRMGWHESGFWVSDVALGRITFFNALGRVARTTRIAVGTDEPFHFPNVPRAVLKGGDFLVEPLLIPRRTGNMRKISTPLLLVDNDGAVLDTVIQLVAGRRHIELNLESERGERSSVYFRQPYDDGHVWDAFADGSGAVVVDRSVTPWDGAIEVYRFDDRGQLSSVVPIRLTALPIVSGDVKTALDQLERRALKSRGASASAKKKIPSLLRDALAVPDFYPPVQAAVAASDHSLWLRREDGGAGFATWIILDSSGTLRGQAHAPADLRILEANGPTVWGAIYDSLHVPYVVRYRLIEN